MMSRRLVRPLLATAFLMAAAIALRPTAEGQDGFSLRTSPETGVPELIFYHGMVLDENQHEIPPTLDNVSRLLRRFADGLMSRSSEAGNARLLETLRKTPPAMEMNKTEELLQSIAAARWLLENGDFPREESLRSTLRSLETWATIPTRQGIDVQLRNNARLAPTLAAMDLDITERAPPTNEYIEKCKAEQVPIPPDWNDPRWKFQYLLDTNYSFVADSFNSFAEVWTYTDPNVPGLCVALPRRDKVTKEIGLFGIICQGDTGKACFWDNVHRGTDDRLTPEESENLKIAEIADGDTLKSENCTNCHRGKNVFVVHPRTALDLSALFDTDPQADWYTPIGQTTWGNPGPMTGLKDCTACHDLPEVADNNNAGPGKAYCRILRQVVDKTMPPTGPAGWLNPRSHKVDIKLLREKCG